MDVPLRGRDICAHKDWFENGKCFNEIISGFLFGKIVLKD